MSKVRSNTLAPLGIIGAGVALKEYLGAFTLVGETPQQVAVGQMLDKGQQLLMPETLSPSDPLRNRQSLLQLGDLSDAPLTTSSAIGKNNPHLRDVLILVSDQHDPLNQALSRAGFDIQLQPFNTLECGAVCIFKRGVEWKVEGDITQINLEMGGRYPAFKLATGFEVFTNQAHCHPIVKLDTQNGDQVFIMRYDEQLQGLDLMKAVYKLTNPCSLTRKHGYGGVVIPMCQMDDRPDISFLLGMKFVSKGGELRGIITQALQQNKLQLDHIGALMESATAVAVSRSDDKPVDLMIDGPFLYAAMRDGFFYFVAQVGTDTMRMTDRAERAGSSLPGSAHHPSLSDGRLQTPEIEADPDLDFFRGGNLAPAGRNTRTAVDPEDHDASAPRSATRDGSASRSG